MTSVPPTHPPAAPETDVRLTEAERNLAARTWYDLDNKPHRTYSEQAVERIVAERVRVIEGERDAAVGALDVAPEVLRLAEMSNQVGYWKTRAESAEAAHRALQAAVAALADEWAEDYPGPTAACNRTPDEWARDLRALLAGGAR